MKLEFIIKLKWLKFPFTVVHVLVKHKQWFPIDSYEDYVELLFSKFIGRSI